MIKCNKEIMQVKRTHLVKRVMLLRNIDLQELTLSFFYKNAKFSASLKIITKTEVLNLETISVQFFCRNGY